MVSKRFQVNHDRRGFCTSLTQAVKRKTRASPKIERKHLKLLHQPSLEPQKTQDSTNTKPLLQIDENSMSRVRCDNWENNSQNSNYLALALKTSVIGIPAYSSSAPLSSQMLDINEDGLRINPSSCQQKTLKFKPPFLSLIVRYEGWRKRDVTKGKKRKRLMAALFSLTSSDNRASFELPVT